MAKVLVEKGGAKVNAKDLKGNTPLLVTKARYDESEVGDWDDQFLPPVINYLESIQDN